ncbi:MAG: hypothetical protein AAB347_03610 [Bacteroidota bacterium]
MMHIDLNKLVISNPKWEDKAKELLEELKNSGSITERNKLIDKYHWYWKLFKPSLRNLSFNKCWYSETRNPFSHYHVDHFRPKKQTVEIDGTELDGYWWLTFDYKNYRLSGSVGNTKKKDHFAVRTNKVEKPGPINDEVYYFLDPTVKEDIGLLNFDNEGKIRPLYPEKTWNNERAKYTIEYLDLNYPDLKEERMIKYQEVIDLIYKVKNLDVAYNEIPTKENKMKLDAEKDLIRHFLKPNQELTATVRSCLRASGENWAFAILEEK